MIPNLLDVENVNKIFTSGGIISRRVNHAVNDVSFSLAADKPEVFTIIGESGSGKTTLSGMILNSAAPTTGRILFRGKDLRDVRSRRDRLEFMSHVQAVFQNPFDAFNPLKRVDRYLFSAAQNFTECRATDEVEERVDDSLRKVGLSLAEIQGRYPHEMSGGQLQRVAIARALVPNRVAAHDRDQPFQKTARRTRGLDRLHHARSRDRLLYQRPSDHHAEGQGGGRRRRSDSAGGATASILHQASRSSFISRWSLA
jgi:ABC-type microcin C transport system duplicated ATPase subunit YejF